MLREIGNRDSAIWLLADSPPRNFGEHLGLPLDDRHIAVHSIFTPIFDKVQYILFMESRTRIDTLNFYRRNAVDDVNTWKAENRKYKEELKNEIREFAKILNDYEKTCKIIFTFGTNAFRFASSALMCADGKNEACRLMGITTRNDKIGNENLGKKSETQRLGYELGKRIKNFNIENINILPLLHVSITRGDINRIIISNREFCKGLNANTDNECSYYVEVSKVIAELFLKYRENSNIRKLFL